MAVIGILGILLVASYTTYRIWAQGQIDDKRPADAIVVMGAAQYDGRPSPIFAARLDHAVALYRAGVARTLVVTGGKADGDRTTEAASARSYAIARGVPPDAILMEDQSRTTQQSIHAVSALLRGKGLSDAIFVSDRPHMLRVLRMAQDDGITAWGSPTATSPIENDTAGRLDATVHELGALALYFLAGTGP
ncbi:MAG: YdcF family protein [Chloroflexota bacterium]